MPKREKRLKAGADMNDIDWAEPALVHLNVEIGQYRGPGKCERHRNLLHAWKPLLAAPFGEQNQEAGARSRTITGV